MKEKEIISIKINEQIRNTLSKSGKIVFVNERKNIRN